MHPRDVMAARIGSLDLDDDLVERHGRCIDHTGAVGRARDDFRRHQRAGIEANGAARDQVAPAHRDQIGRARPGADEMHRHLASPALAASTYPRGV